MNQIIQLPPEACQYVADTLASGVGLCRHIKTPERVYTYLPPHAAASNRALEFDIGGWFKSSEATQFLKDKLDALSRGGSAVICQALWFPPKNVFEPGYSESGWFTDGAGVYYQLNADFDLRSLRRAVGQTSYPSLVILSGERVQLTSSRTVSSEVTTRVAATSAFVALAAYDGESFLMWENQ